MVSAAATTEDCRVLFVSPPWASLEQPSLALGLLKARLARAGVGSRVAYANLDFAEAIGVDLYRSLKDRDVLVCEWVFSEALSVDIQPAHKFIAFLKGLGYSRTDLSQWSAVQKAAAPFVSVWAERPDLARYKIFGFTTSMIQTVPALALAKRIKELHPEAIIVFGGANCEREMGVALLRNFEFIDVVVRRECDDLAVDLFRRLLDGHPLDDLPVCFRRNDGLHVNNMPPPFRDLDGSPYPDYQDYFDQLMTKPFADQIKVNIVFEGSRGCWFGQKKSCMFCAVNGSLLSYRAKSPDRLADELAYLADRYRVRWFGAADNILMKEVEQLCTRIAERVPNAKIFYDVKANVRRPQLVAMKKAGIDEVQPGIESFSDRVLKLMHKGTTGTRNVHMLRMCTEVGIWPMWNYLYGFPGERQSDYAGLMEWIAPGLFHLPPPYVCFGLSMMRFSEYFEKPEENGIQISGPLPHYDFIYDLPREEVKDLAYYFDFSYSDGYDPANVGALVKKTGEAWNYAYYKNKVELTGDLGDDGATVIIQDTRFGALVEHRLIGLAARYYRSLESPASFNSVARRLSREFPADYLFGGGLRGLEHIANKLRRARLVFSQRNRDLAVAVPRNSAVFWGTSTEEAPADNAGRPLPNLLHWKVDHLYS